MCIQKAELMFSRPILKGFLCFIFFVFQSGSSDKVQKVIAKLGDEAKLPCNYRIPPGESITNYNIYWQTPEKPTPLVVNFYVKDEEDDHIDVRYKNRTKINEQNLTLSIFSVKVSDERTYECIIIKDVLVSKSRVDLSVVADFSKPIINEKPLNACGPVWLTLTCTSDGGYPRPMMLGSINNNTETWHTITTQDNKTGRFQITGNLQHNMTENILVHCSVEYQDLKVSTNFSLSMCPSPPMPPSYGIIIASAVLFIFLLAGVLLRILCYCHTCKYSRSSHPVRSFQLVATAEMTPQQLSNEASRAVS
uniref:T-lymphocyte activation antigen CD86-like isoform X1 n=1 Tax=Pogona vitticeps TaxID=103695 RepID=A0A6J0V0P9_9SAUR